MKPIRITTLLAFVAGLVFASGALAVEQRSGAMQTDESATIAMNLHSAEQFIGTQVRDARGQQLGTVTDVMINFNGGRVGYAQVTAQDGQTYLVPLSAFDAAHEGEFVTLETDRSRMAAAPRFEEGMTEEEYGRRLHEFYGAAYPWSDLPGDVPVRQEQLPAPNLTYPGHREVIPEEGSR